MPLRISSQEESINWYFSLHGQIFQEEEVKGIVWGIKGEFFIIFLSSFQFLIRFFQSFAFVWVFYFSFFAFISRWHTVFRLSQNVQAFASMFGGMIYFIFFSLCIRKYTICKKPTVSLTRGSRRGGGGCLGRSGKCLRQLKQAPNSPRNVWKQRLAGLCDKAGRRRGEEEGNKPFGHSSRS